MENDPCISEERYLGERRGKRGKILEGQSLKPITVVGCGRNEDHRSGPR
jgi:hypothetical protein